MASLQELPPVPGRGRTPKWKLPSLLEASSLQARGLQLWGPIGPGRVAILTNHGMAMDGPQWVDSNARMLGVPISGNNKKLMVIGIHAVDRSNPEARTDFQRGSHAALTRRQIDEIWDKSRALVLLGDWNAKPVDEEITLREGFFFRSEEELKDLSSEDAQHYGKPSPPLLNLMRCLDGDPAAKSYYWPTTKLPYLFDQVIVSSDLGPLAGKPVVKQQISAISLRTSSSKKRPNKAKYSDHLPVEVTIPI